MLRLSVGSLVLLLTAGCFCGGSIQRPATSDLVLQGRVSLTSGVADTSPLSGAEVRISCDRNKNGQLESDEIATATTDDEGNYKLQMKVNKGERVVVRFSSSSAAPIFKSIDAGPWADLTLNATLRELDSFDCEDATSRKCTLDGNKLSLSGLGEGISGSARVFNPEKETSAFPGAFDDSDGNLLISGAFAAVQLEDSSGNPISQLDTPADLRMRVPPETWFQITDLSPGDDRIQIPLYSFNEISGEWVREADGFLETSTGAIIPEARLADIRAGNFDEGVMACGKVSHFSYWNVDWPIDTKQCITGVVLGDDGKPAEGAVVQISGVTYTGTSTPITVGADGKFCTDVMRSEAAGESVDQDDALGETQRISIRIFYGSKIYDGGEHDVPNTPASCGGPGCLDLGDLPLSTAKEIVPALCTVKGKVLDAKRVPVEGVGVFFNDPSVPQEVRDDLCGFASINCTLFAASGADGSFEVTSPLLDGALLYAFTSETDTARGVDFLRLGWNETEGCTSKPLDIVLNDGVATVNLTVSVSNQQISWTPARNIHSVIVTGADGTAKWGLTSSSTDGFAGPLTYGTVPANATQIIPEMGAPPPLASGDDITLTVVGEIDGIPLYGAGTAKAP